MRYFSMAIVFMLVLVLSFSAGCSKSGNPIEPDVEYRIGQGFYSKINIFDTRYHDSDLAALRTVDDGDPSAILAKYWCASVSLKYENPFIPIYYPYYAWLDDDSVESTGDAVNQDHYSITYKLPKCDACYFPDDDKVELAVCYMWKDQLEVGAEWAVSVTLTEFDDGIDFPDTVLGYTTYGIESDYECFEPDIAYDYDNGDIYVTYVRKIDYEGYNRGLYYQRFDRGTETWSGEKPLWEVGEPHNAYNPRIDVGWVTDMDPPDYSGDDYMVGIVYAGEGYNDDSDLDLYAVYWDHTESDSSDKTDHHWELGSDNIYLPYLDIAPDSNGNHYYAVVYMRYANEQNYDYEVLEVNSISNTTPLRIYRYSDRDYVQPSIVLHYKSGTTGDHFSSISVLQHDMNGVY